MNRSSAGSVADTFSAKQAAKLSGLSLDMVNYLCRNEIVAPSGGDRRKRGVKRLYAFSDMLLLRAVAKLLDNGISVLRLQKSFARLRVRHGQFPTELLTKKYLVIDGQDVFIQDGDLLERLESGQLAFAFVLELNSLRSDLSASVQQQSVANG